MVRIAILVGAVLVAALLASLPDSLQPSPQVSWAGSPPDLWSTLGLSAKQTAGADFICPMDRDVTSPAPGYCPRCRMKLVPAVLTSAEPKEYSVNLTTRPSVLRPSEDTEITARIEDPETAAPVRDFEMVHEKLYHFFVVGQDLSFFLHAHPQKQPDGSFHLKLRVPKPGMYRVLSDFYPKNATPQLVTGTLLAAGDGFKLRPAKLAADLAPQQGENTNVELVTDPPHPLAHEKTRMFFRMKPNDGIEPYLGAMAHMLAASSDLVDMMHNHPLMSADSRDYKELQFKMVFPRPGVYRIWIQSQRKGVVNTVAFNVPVVEK